MSCSIEECTFPPGQGWEFAHRFASERPEQIAHGRSFLVSDLSDSLTSLNKKEGMSESFIFLKNVQKSTQKNEFSQIFLSDFFLGGNKRANERFAKKMRDLLIPSFIMSDLSESLTVALLS